MHLKPLYKSSEVKAYWDVPVFAEHEHLPQNRVDARFIDHKEKVRNELSMDGQLGAES